MKQIWGTLHPFFEAGPVYGRTAANAGFLTALLHADPFDEYHFFVPATFRAHLKQQLEQHHSPLVRAKRVRILPEENLPSQLAQTPYVVFHLSDAFTNFVELTVLRNAVSRAIFPITAPVHTLSYQQYAPGLLRHLWPGLSGREAIVGTSACTRTLLHNYFTSLRTAYGLDEHKFPAPQTPVIPHGVDPALFAAPQEKDAAGAIWRERLHLRPDQLLFLCFSRISAQSKMDALPILDAFRRAMGMGLSPDSFRLVLAGRKDGGDTPEDALRAQAAQYGIPFSLAVFPPSGGEEERKALFAAADIFLSPVDNIQETFGLTILEAQAAGLPVIAAEIDGYRDIIEHGVNGLLVPTIGPADTAISNACAGIFPQSLTHFSLAQQCAVQSIPFARSILSLASQPERRRDMGLAGYQRVTTDYSWHTVLKQYLTLWKSLAATQLPPAQQHTLRSTVHPSFPDYGARFGHYFTQQATSPLLAACPVRTSPKGHAVLAKQEKAVVYSPLLPLFDAQLFHTLLDAARTDATFGSLLALCPPTNTADAHFTLLWAVKHDYLEIGERDGEIGGE